MIPGTRLHSCFGYCQRHIGTAIDAAVPVWLESFQIAHYVILFVRPIHNKAIIIMYPLRRYQVVRRPVIELQYYTCIAQEISFRISTAHDIQKGNREKK